MSALSLPSDVVPPDTVTPLFPPMVNVPALLTAGSTMLPHAETRPIQTKEDSVLRGLSRKGFISHELPKLNTVNNSSRLCVLLQNCRASA
jgi:hypothetical protein